VNPSWDVTVLHKSDFHSVSYPLLLFRNTKQGDVSVSICPLSRCGLKSVQARLRDNLGADHSITIILDKTQCAGLSTLTIFLSVAHDLF